ncbi:glycoside hydrolase family 2 protein [Mucilaginibacter sp. SMC90]|uniref:glycoside hydrolase family 2 protein n=1 Tax=Mucilaginibacter sp. SMC90 TaxID=2929803 RepID=UPI001FB41B2C|nr:glycoside hydrolase family 2 protein [Mucilaginibacter sp. SMC90]UOE47246.1 glycoside hydrolase family 2 protein [Mucilaginibacter sp. SMC90]
MNKSILRSLFSLLFITAMPLFSLATLHIANPEDGREVINLNKGWQFYFAYDVRQHPDIIDVTLPHTWNASEAFSKNLTYKRETGIYTKKIPASRNWDNKRVFLYFEGANSVATVLVNKHFVTTHKGGYTAFCVEVTHLIKPGQNNTVEVQVSNASRPDVLPLCGDFNVYGGIHRPVSLIVTDKDCITPLDYASSGIYITQRRVSEASADLDITTKLSLTNKSAFKIKTEVLDSAGKIIVSSLNTVSDTSKCAQSLTIKRPILWNGLQHPYLYRVKVQLMRNNMVIDQIEQPLGLRYFKVTADKGFFLNGRYLDLHGFGLHEDAEGIGSAYTPVNYRTDIALAREAGATALRLTHYPHGQYLYNLCDSTGLVLWSEIPFVGPGGYTGSGYIKNGDLESQARQVLTEMIRQNYNHPSICFWGLFNELKLDSDDPIPFLKELRAQVQKEDPTRLTTCATFLDNEKLNTITDVIAWNRYFGWYGGDFKEMGTWADKVHRLYPQMCFGISEYGAGASPYKHTEQLSRPNPEGRFHPEAWQAFYHEQNWRELNERPFVWAKFVWCLADFGSSIRTEGDSTGMNDKGLVTYNRKLRKDAFYFYKANWSNQPVLYITDRRNTQRSKPTTDIKAYATYKTVNLFVNGKLVSEPAKPDAYHVVQWKDVPLQKGVNNIVIKAGERGKLVSDSCKWVMAE